MFLFVCAGTPASRTLQPPFNAQQRTQAAGGHASMGLMVDYDDEEEEISVMGHSRGNAADQGGCV